MGLPIHLWWQSHGNGARIGDTVSLAEARDKARDARKMVEAGENPIEARRRAASAEAGIPTFGAVADALIAAKESEWRNEKHRAQWRTSLTDFAAPLRCRPVDEIDTAAVLAVLTPLWQVKPETASRVRGRIEAVLDAAKAQGHRSGETRRHGAATSRTFCQSAGSSRAGIMPRWTIATFLRSLLSCASAMPSPQWR
jgi:Arm DNA-binding domain